MQLWTGNFLSEITHMAFAGFVSLVEIMCDITYT